jgi:hypothetical protein
MSKYTLHTKWDTTNKTIFINSPTILLRKI